MLLLQKTMRKHWRGGNCSFHMMHSERRGILKKEVWEVGTPSSDEYWRRGYVKRIVSVLWFNKGYGLTAGVFDFCSYFLIVADVSSHRSVSRPSDELWSNIWKRKFHFWKNVDFTQRRSQRPRKLSNCLEPLFKDRPKAMKLKLRTSMVKYQELNEIRWENRGTVTEMILQWEFQRQFCLGCCKMTLFYDQ